jgi:selenium metabolism protein YedF
MKRTIVINSQTMGRDSEELGEQIMGSFLRQVLMSSIRPDAIILYNSGVKLLTEDSPVSDAMDALFKRGVDIIACGTCVAYYHLNDKIAVGRVSNMQEIASILLDSERVITI